MCFQIWILNVEVFAISSSSTFENGDVGEEHAQRELPIWDVEKSFFNIMRNGNILLVQGLIDNKFGCFVFVRKHFKGWGASASRACAGRRPAPPCLEIFSYKLKHPNMLSIRPWTRRLFPFLIMLNKLFSTSQIGSSLCACDSPTSPFSNVDDELIAKSLAQTPFTSFRIENALIKLF